MTPHAHAFVTMRRVHAALVDWFLEIVRAVGVADAQVYSRFPPDDPPHPYLVVLAHEVRPFPKIAENQDEVPLMSAAGDRRFSVPEPWARIGQILGDVVPGLYGSADPRARGRSGTTLGALPPSLAVWHEARRERSSGASWVVETPAGPYARAPSLTWRRSLPIEARFLVFASDHLLPGGGGEPPGAAFGLPTLAAAYVALHVERVMFVDLPPPEIDADLTSYLRALAEAIEPERADALRAAMARIDGEQRHRIPISAQPDVDAEHLQYLSRVHTRAPAMVSPFAVQLLIGGSPCFLPGATPHMNLTPQR